MNAGDPSDETRPTEKPRNCHIGIIGGGTAGWMCAATLKRRLKCRVTLVQPSDIPGIGVGEATIPAMVDWIHNMGIDEETFLRRTAGTFKLAIRFDDWVRPIHRYWHPFGVCDGDIDGIDAVHFWQRGIDEGWLDGSTNYSDFCIQRSLCETNRGPRMIDGPQILDNYAYHLDAGKLASFLQEIAMAEGVEHRIGTVADASLDDRGNISKVHLTSGETLASDWFVDCSGFASVLIEKVLGSKWTDWSDQLICDSAITTRVAANSAMQPYTISTGLSAGWAWQIPLQDTTGTGYVYSSKHISHEDARNELLQHVGAEHETKTHQIGMRIGMRTKSWVNNCLSIGLSSGFVEPLESTGIFLVQRALDEFVDCLDSRPATAQDTFNTRMTEVYQQIRDFVLMHYVVSERDDTTFWQEASNVTPPDSLTRLLFDYETKGKVFLPKRFPTFAEANHHFVLAGANRTVGKRAEAFRHPAPDLESYFQSIRSGHQRLTSVLPDHRSLINSIDQSNRDVLATRRSNSLPPHSSPTGAA